jgi:hypothetical protein
MLFPNKQMLTASFNCLSPIKLTLTIALIQCNTIKGVFNYYLQKMYNDGTLKKEWNAHVLRQATREPCNIAATRDEDGDVNRRSRYLLANKADVKHRYHAKLSSSSSEAASEVPEESIDLRQMVRTVQIYAHPHTTTTLSPGYQIKCPNTFSIPFHLTPKAGTFLVHFIGIIIAILCSLLSLLEEKKHKATQQETPGTC